jgi:hypothetical protein
MSLSRHHLIALGLSAGGLVSIALTDAVTHGLTGHNSVFSDDSGRPGWIIVGGLGHSAAYAAQCWVLVAERDRFAGANRFARLLRGVLLVSLALLAVGFAVVSPILILARVPLDGAVGTAWGLVATVGFGGMILGALLLGLALLRTNPLGLGGRVLAAVLPVAGLTVALAAWAPAWAHPAYVETVLAFGIALLGVRPAAAPVASAATPHLVA